MPFNASSLQGLTGPAGQQGPQGEPGLDGDPLDFLNVPSNIVPILDDVYTLGTPEKRWHSVYLGTQSIDMIDDHGNSVTLSTDQGSLVIDGADIVRVGNMNFTSTGIESAISAQDITIGNFGDEGYALMATGVKYPDNTVQTTAPIQSDWNETNTSSLAYINNKPDIDGSIGNQTVRYSPIFQATGLTFTGSGPTYPTYNSYYVKTGKMVSFAIEVDMSTVTNFGTGQYKLQLPFTPAIGYNHFTGWAHVDTTVNPDVTTGHIILNIDHAGVTDILDLHYLKQAGGAHTPIVEGLFLQGTPVILTSSSKVYVNGTYISA